MSSLNGTVTLMHMHIISMLVTEDLHLNMARVNNILLNNHVIIIETFLRFPLGRIKLVIEFIFCHNDSHAFSSTTERCFEHDGKADLT